MAMQKNQISIEILRTPLKHLSSLSIESANGMYEELVKHYEDVRITNITSFTELKQLVGRNPDLVITGLSQIPGLQPGSFVWVSTYLEDNNISHTGSSAPALALETNKALAKQRVLEEGLPTSPFLVIKNGVPYLDNSLLLSFPMFVKPTSMGGGVGIDNKSVVHSFADLRTKTSSISLKHSSDSLVEQYLSGREYSVAVLKEEFSDELMAMPIEIVTVKNAAGDRILSKEVKAQDEEVTHAVTDLFVRKQLIDIAIGVFNALGAKDYGRIDIRMDEFGTPHFLEANLIPSLINGYGNFPKACEINIGMSYSEMLLHIVRLGVANNPSLAEQQLEPLSI